jgi:hypothetical protein
MHSNQECRRGYCPSGELVLEFDSGAETLLRTGDIVVQTGKRHRWHNRGRAPA